MRVISGSAKGRRLNGLEGETTRPTTDRVKEGLFNVIQFEIEGQRVLDLFAGTGQLGIECLSRGAAGAVFVEERKDAVALVRENLSVTRLQDRARVIQGDAMSFLAVCKERFHVIFLDPPYETGRLERAMEQIAAFDILDEHGIMMCESPVGQVLPELPAPYTRGKTYRYGKIAVTLYRREESAQ